MRRRRSSAALLAAALLAPASARAYFWSDPLGSSTAPAAASMASDAALPRDSARSRVGVTDPERQAQLSELRLRRIIAQDRREWGSDEYTLLLRIREAQAMGAFALLRAKLGTLAGFAVERGPREAGRLPELWLTKEGYERYAFLRSQDARAYFETRRAPAKFVFELKDMAGRLLFDRDGLLTEAGGDVYNRVLRGMPTFWRFPDGRVTGNVRPPDGGLPAPAEAPAAEVNEQKARKRISDLVASGYVEVTPAEVALLRQASGRSDEQLAKETSLQAVPAKNRTYYLMSPSDPLFKVVSKARTGGSNAGR